ncbi:uncharacterized protein PG986_010966 [Apiospora aurea]|uniref:Ribonuclease H1 N-terminal domain-containing protein n=1 Tax=Apiospora aurea TaxID=335848 RepID=A0ABR1Q3V7_9PEZI
MGQWQEDNGGGARGTHVGKYYAVAIGKVPGIYYDWATAEKQVKAHPGARYKGFWAHAEAEAFVRRHGNHFAMVPDFRPDSSAPFGDEFERFASSQGIVPGSKEYLKQRTTAIKREFDVLYLSQPIKEEDENEDKEEDDKSDSRDDMDIKDESLTEDELILRAFHDLCRHVNVEPGPTARDCELAIKRVGPINIVDFLDAERTGKPVQIWPWSQFSQFRRYTLGDRDKCIHLGQAKEHPLLRALLQDLSSKNADKHARYIAAQQNNANALTIIEMRPKLREFNTLLERVSHPARTISPVVQEAVVPAAPFQNAYDSSSASRAVSATPAAAVEVKEEEPELPMNSISQDGPPQATNTEDAPQHQQFVRRERAPQPPILPTITVARSPPPTIATPGPSSPGGPSQRQPAVKRESPQFPPSPPVENHPLPTPDTTASQPRRGRGRPKKGAAAAPPVTPMRRSARIAATSNTSPQEEGEENTTSDACVKDVPTAMTPATRQKRKTSAVIEIPDSDSEGDHGPPAAKKLKQGTLHDFFRA